MNDTVKRLREEADKIAAGCQRIDPHGEYSLFVERHNGWRNVWTLADRYGIVPPGRGATDEEIHQFQVAYYTARRDHLRARLATLEAREAERDARRQHSGDFRARLDEAAQVTLDTRGAREELNRARIDRDRAGREAILRDLNDAA